MCKELQGGRASQWAPGWMPVYFLWVVKIHNTQEVCEWYMLVVGHLHVHCDRGLLPDQWWWVILQQSMKQEEKSIYNFAPGAPWTKWALEASIAPLLCNMKVHQRQATPVKKENSFLADLVLTLIWWLVLRLFDKDVAIAQCQKIWNMIKNGKQVFIHSFLYFPFIHLQVQPKDVEIVIACCTVLVKSEKTNYRRQL